MNVIMEICANMLNALNEYVQTSCTTSGNIICRRFKLVYIEVERAKAEDFDAEEGELLKDEEVFDQGSFLPFFDELSSYLMPMWVRKDKSAEERRISNCIFDDIAEKCRDTALMYPGIVVIHISHSYWRHAMMKTAQMSDRFAEDLNYLLFSRNLNHVNLSYLYRLGVCAEFGSSMFKSLVGAPSLLGTPMLCIRTM
ncbi:hypothetical protein OROGR_025157 [Orobanche gracilis]